MVENHDINRIVGQNIRRLRVPPPPREIMPINHLATRIGVNRNLLSKIEKGERSITIEALYEIANIYGVPINYFLYRRLDEPRSVETVPPIPGRRPSDYR